MRVDWPVLKFQSVAAGEIAKPDACGNENGFVAEVY